MGCPLYTRRRPLPPLHSGRAVGLGASSQRASKATERVRAPLHRVEAQGQTLRPAEQGTELVGEGEERRQLGDGEDLQQRDAVQRAGQGRGIGAEDGTVGETARRSRRRGIGEEPGGELLEEAA